MLRQNSRSSILSTSTSTNTSSTSLYYPRKTGSHQPYHSSFNLLATRCTMAPTNEVRLSVSESLDRSTSKPLFTKLSSPNSTFTIVIFHRQNVQKMVRSTADLIELDAKLRATHGNGCPSLPPLDERRRILSRHIFSRKTTSERLESYLSKLLNDVVLANDPAVKHFLKFGGDPEPSSVSLSRRGSLGGQSLINKRASSIYSLRPSPPILRGFQIIKVLGTGAMGKVFLVKDTSNGGKLRAMKTISKERAISQTNAHNTRTERSILASLESIRSPFLVSLFSSFQTSSRLFFILDYHPGGDLATHLSRCGRFSEDRARFYACQIILALKVLHSNGILYRDLKPENILLSSTGNIVLTDFSLSKRLDNHAATTFCGTSQYLAPEVLRGEDYGFAVDWWSLGVVLYEMLVGQTPFYASSDPAIYERVIEGDLIFPETDCLSPGAISLIGALLLRDPKHRLGGDLGADEVVEYPYFDGVNWDDYANLRVPAPYVPQSNPSSPQADPETLDFRFFDESFLSMEPKVSPCPSIASSSCSFASFQPACPTTVS